MNCSYTESEVSTRREDLRRISGALDAAVAVLRSLDLSHMQVEFKGRDNPVTIADRAINEQLRALLPINGDGWLSEETADDPIRLEKRRVWVVDPLDGTKEFVSHIPEWCVSIGLVEDGQAVAGGVCNPATGEVVIGSRETGVTYKVAETSLANANGRPVTRTAQSEVGRPLVLASRSETNRGEWDWLREAPFEIRPMGSVAYKLALVAALRADATWTLVPKHEWDVAAGVALVLASGGMIRTLDGQALEFNRPRPRLNGLIAYSKSGNERYGSLFDDWLRRRNNRPS